jgi:protein-tyrosine phosphatase
MNRLNILFVCTGNICRSPLAEGIFARMVANAGRAAEFDIDSAGTGGWHQSDPPDRRSIAVAAHHGIDISGQRARRITAIDFDRYDLILAMDHDNVRSLLQTAPSRAQAKIHLFDAFTTAGNTDVPDPYYGDGADFEAVYAMLFAGCTRLLETAGKL